MVEVHVGEARGRVVTALAHLVERDRPHPPLVLLVPRAGVEHLMAPREVLVDPPVGGRTVAALARDLVPLDPFDRVVVMDDARSALSKPCGKPPRPHVRWLDDMVVDGDDQRQIGNHLRCIHRARLPESMVGLDTIAAG